MNKNTNQLTRFNRPAALQQKHFIREETMKSRIKMIVIVLAALLVATAWTNPLMAAINQAVDGGGGGVTLQDSLNVTVTSTQLGLVKVVYDTSGNCLASSDSDAACNGGANSISVPTGTTLRFVIYVANTAAVTASDIRFVDNIDDVAVDYFEFQANTYGAGQGIMWGTRAATGATKANIYTAVTGGTAVTNALDGSTQVNEYAGIDTAVSPDVLYVGGDASSPDNDQVDVAADTVFAVTFDVIKRD